MPYYRYFLPTLLCQIVIQGSSRPFQVDDRVYAKVRGVINNLVSKVKFEYEIIEQVL